MPTTLEKRTGRVEPGTIRTGDFLDTPVRQIMTPGVVSIVEDASLSHLHRVMTIHNVQHVLVLGRTQGRALGWVTARGLLAWVDLDYGLACARDAITEPPLTIEPGASAREALTALSQAGTSVLLVAHNPERLPEGVLTALDLIALAGSD